VHAVKGAAEVWPAAQVLAAEAPATEKVPTTVSFVQAELMVMAAVALAAAAVVATLRVMVLAVKAVTVAPAAMPVPVIGQPT